MKTAVQIFIVALTLAVGGYLVFKPENVYAEVLKGRSRGKVSGRGLDPHRREADVMSIRSAGAFIIFAASQAIYLWFRTGKP